MNTMNIKSNQRVFRKPISNARTQKRKNLIMARKYRKISVRFNKRKRLERAQFATKNNFFNSNIKIRRPRQYGKYKKSRNFMLRNIIVKGLPRSVNDKELFNLFRYEGRLVKCWVIYDKLGLSKGLGEMVFANPRDTWKVIQKWNNTFYKGKTLKIVYKWQKRYLRNHNKIFNNQFANYNNGRQKEYKYKNSLFYHRSYGGFPFNNTKWPYRKGFQIDYRNKKYSQRN